ncbi:MAG: amidohydrolase family protein [Gemmatimonadota bacterium]
MRSTRTLLAALLGLVNLPPQSAAAQQSPVAFVDVTVIPMDRERVIERQTVVVENGRIAAMGPTSSVRVPPGAVRIEGRGRFLMPGLAEMHAHVPPNAASEQLLRDIMFLYIANGVTTIRGMLGAPYQIDLRRRLSSGELLGPRFYVGAPSINGNSAPDPATGARLVREHKTAGYDLLKIHPGPSRATYDSVVTVARQVGISLGGHVPGAVGVAHALESSQATIDHLDQYIEGAVSDDIKRRVAAGDTVWPAEMHRSVTAERMRELARATAARGVWNVPTMYLWENFGNSKTAEELSALEEMKYAQRQWLTGWQNQKRQRANVDRQLRMSQADNDLLIGLRRQMLKALADAGAPLLMGTDSPQMFNVPGFALHRELRVAIDAGLTPYQVLESGSRNVARYAREVLKQEANYGTVTLGSDADLVLLEANPLQNVGNLQRRAGVMVRGRWVSGEEITRGLADLEARIRAQ